MQDEEGNASKKGKRYEGGREACNLFAGFNFLLYFFLLEVGSDGVSLEIQSTLECISRDSVSPTEAHS